MKHLSIKKIIVFLAFLIGSQDLYADQTSCTNTPCTNWDCSNPSQQYFVTGQPTFTCGTYSDPQAGADGRSNICAYNKAGGMYTSHTVSGCTQGVGAPINSGLIFLLIAGAGAGFYLLSKEKTNQEMALSGTPVSA